MENISVEEVFTPQSYPEETYIERKSESGFTYEKRLQIALKNKGSLISVTGPSKTGKTMLCEKLIPYEHRVLMTGKEFDEGIDFWSAIAKKIKMSMYGEFEENKEITNDLNTKGSTVKKVFVTHKDDIVKYFLDNNKVLILDDFHYASAENQQAAAYYLKDVIRFGFKAIIISLPHRSDTTIRLNPDLSGRVDCIELEPWDNEDLRKISKIGFDKLEIELPTDIEDEILIESLSSPSLMQRICLFTATSAIERNDSVISIDNYQEGLKLANLNYGFKDAVDYLKQGPSSRGQKRKLFNIYNSTEGDLYEILLHIIAENPPNTCLSLDEIQRRSERIISGVAFEPAISKSKGTKVNKVALKRALASTQENLNKRPEYQHLMEWKDNCLYVLDPEFIFYLRWSPWDKGVGRKGRGECF